MNRPAANLFFAAIAATLLSLATSAAAQAGDLTVDVKNVGEKGNVMVALFKSSDKWLGKSSFGTIAPAKSAGVSVTFKDVEPGDYAISLFVDENTNGKMDTNAIGIPLEPYAFSNDAMGSFGPPSFEKAKFSVGKESKTITISIK